MKLKALNILIMFVSVLLAAGSPSFGQNAETLDPSKPTNLYSYIDTSAEWQGFEQGNTWGLRIMPTWALNNKNMFQAEIPLQWPDFEGVDKGAGIGDIRIRYFGIPIVLESTLSHIGVSVDLFMPTGDEKKGLGSGSWIIAPGILLGIAASEKLNFYPIVSYQYSTRAANTTAGGSKPGGGVPPGPGESDKDGTTHGISVEVMCVLGLPNNMWLQLIPKYSSIFKGPESESFNARISWGWMLKDNISLTVDFLNEFANRDGLRNHLRVGIGYYF